MSLYENYGSWNYCEITLPEGAWEWCYSAEALQKALEAAFTGEIVRGLYVALHEYTQSVLSKPNVVDLSYTGGVSLLLSENTALALRFRGEGMAEYRLLPAESLTVREISGFLPDDMVRNRRYFFDLLHHERTCDYAGQRAERVRVPRTTVWALPTPGFDEDRGDMAGAAFDLPGEVYFTLENGVSIRFIGDETEYYCILLEPGQR